MNEQGLELKYATAVRVYNETKNLGEMHYFDENGNELFYKHFKIEDNKEVFIESPKEERYHKMFIPLDLDHTKKAPIINLYTKEEVALVNGEERVLVDQEKALLVRGSDAQNKVKHLSDGDQLLLFDCLSQEKGAIKTVDEKFAVSVSEKDIEKIFPTNMPATIYSNVDPATEFGVARFMADQVYHLSSLLHVAEVKHYGEVGYGIFASKQISPDNRLDFSYRFTATDAEDAKEIARHIKQQLNGIMRKIWLAAWSVGDEKKKHTFSVSLSRLMSTCYPERNSNFSETEIEEFYQLLKSMKPAEFVLVKRFREKGKGKEIEEHEAKFIISFLQVHFETGKKNKTPSDVLISLYNVTPLPTQKEKNRYLGAAIKRDTLKLHAKDTSFALWLQTRINQLKAGGIKKKEIYSNDFQRSALIEEANLQKTDASNPRRANKYLLEKLARCKEQKIIKRFPSKIGETVKIEW